MRCAARASRVAVCMGTEIIKTVERNRRFGTILANALRSAFSQSRGGVHGNRDRDCLRPATPASFQGSTERSRQRTSCPAANNAPDADAACSGWCPSS